MEHSYLIHKDLSTNNGNKDMDRDVQRYNDLKRHAKFKWVTYLRNGSWFISPHSKLRIIKQAEAKTSINNDSKFIIKFENAFIPVIDIFSQFSQKKKEQIKFFIIAEFNNELKCFAADRLGKIIMADKDFITPNLKAFKKTKLSSGRVRLFGKNHIYL